MTEPLDRNAVPSLPFVAGLRCLRCGRFYMEGEVEYVCDCRPNVGSDLGTLAVEYNYQAIEQSISLPEILGDAETTMGRWWPLLPVSRRQSLPPLPVGDTPLLQASRLGRAIGLSSLFLKDEGRNPTASLKDRASAIAVARAGEAGREVVATASTGNAAAALAGQAAAAGQANVIFVPKSAPEAKIAQLLVYGSRVLAVDGSYDQAFDLCVAACEEFDWYNRNTGFNPFMTEGKKTVAFEIAAQLGFLRTDDRNSKPSMVAPDAVFVSVGDGCIVGGIHKGFKDLFTLKWIDRMPRIYGVQSTRSSSLADAWEQGLEVPQAVKAATRADSISVNAPRDAVKALSAVRQTGGAYIKVADRSILQAISPLARLGAVFAEPAGAAAYAGLLEALDRGMVQAEETVVVVNTGSGLKDVPAVMQVTGDVRVIAPRLEEVRAV